MSKSILVVEDEAAIADSIRFALQTEGYAVTVLADGEAAAEAPVDDYDLVVLDLMLPKLSGHEVCRRLRTRSIVPILMLTARSAEADRVMGLELGADDYLGKPFSMAELLGRIRAMLRRREMDRRDQAATTRQVGGLHLDLVQRVATIDQRRVDLTPLEFSLLAFLAERPDRAVSRRAIAERLWRSHQASDDGTMTTHVKNLRRKIERDPSCPQRLVTVRGIGYLLRAK